MDTLPRGLGLDADAPIAQRLAEFTHAVRAENIPADVIAQAKRHLLDCLGIALASSGFEFGVRTATAIAGLAGDGEHPVIGLAIRLPLRDAVLVNGTFIHGLDYDDTHSDAVVHASASAVPTALHMARAHRATGLEALAAYVLGVEASARIGAAAQGGFHQVGFHPTGMVGAFGAALTAGRLAGATPRQMQAAQGIVLSMAAGSLEFLADGSWTKRIHPGWAGVAGITATALARGGFKGPPRPYEGRFGLFASHLQERAPADLSRCAAHLGEVWEMRNVALKPYPCCHFNHAFADAALALRAAHGLRPEEIARITCRIHEGQVKVVCEPEAAKRAPANSYEAQFSVHYAVCAALVRGRFGLDDLEEEAIQDPEILSLMARTGYETDPTSRFPRYYGGEVVVELRDGRVLRHREEMNRGSDGNPLSQADVERKFLDNARRVLSAARAQQVLDLAMTLDRAPGTEALTDALSG
ncbi:MmgE/PrpD family protein [Paracraurococcus ruber]|uniref:MmgE/PrpD family protein n=1 Tax=Paracraurococcus ruber TaxID=77675 RepID=UPI00190666E8|nr:MmgE/PrpD family protein [Paracraurococcus ruber]